MDEVNVQESSDATVIKASDVQVEVVEEESNEEKMAKALQEFHIHNTHLTKKERRGHTPEDLYEMRKYRYFESLVEKGVVNAADKG